MAINDDIIVVAGKSTPTAIDVETKTTIKHAKTGKVTPMKKRRKPTLMTLQPTQQKRI